MYFLVGLQHTTTKEEATVYTLPNVTDICWTNCLVVINGSGGICACKSGVGEIEWSVEGKLPGMEKQLKGQSLATDGQGHLFVSDDGNGCVQMFTTDGKFIGPGIRNTTLLGTPELIRWNDKTSSLVVSFKKKNKQYISMIKFDQDL